MVSDADLKIWLALRSRLDDLSVITGFDIEWPNTSFTPTEDGYLRVTHTPNAPIRVTHGSEDPHERMGIVQVRVSFPRGDEYVPGVDNTARVLKKGALIADHFPPDLRMEYDDVVVKVMRAPRVGGVVNPSDSAFAECVVEIPYRCSA